MEGRTTAIWLAKSLLPLVSPAFPCSYNSLLFSAHEATEPVYYGIFPCSRCHPITSFIFVFFHVLLTLFGIRITFSPYTALSVLYAFVGVHLDSFADFPSICFNSLMPVTILFTDFLHVTQFLGLSFPSCASSIFYF